MVFVDVLYDLHCRTKLVSCNAGCAGYPRYAVGGLVVLCVLCDNPFAASTPRIGRRYPFHVDVPFRADIYISDLYNLADVARWEP